MHSLVVGLMAPEGPLRESLSACLRDLPVRVFFEPTSPADWGEFLERLARLETDALLVDAGRWGQAFHELASRVKSVKPAPHLIAAGTSDDDALRAHLLRAGADEFLAPPFEQSLKQALARVAERRLRELAGGRETGKLVGLIGAKGGCGVTTVAYLLALALRRLTQTKVLLADLDWPGGMVGFLTKVQTPYSLLDAARQIHRLDLGYWKTLVGTHETGLEVLPAPGPVPPETINGERLRGVLRFARACYQWVVLDLGDCWHETTPVPWEDFETLWLVSGGDVMSLYQARRAAGRLAEGGADTGRLRLLLNRWKGAGLPADLVESLVGLPPYARLPESGELEEALQGDRPWNLDTGLGKQVLKLARRLSGVPENRPQAGLSLLPWRITLRERIPPPVPRS